MACPACGFGDSPAGAAYCAACGRTFERQSSGSVQVAQAAATVDFHDAPTLPMPTPSAPGTSWSCACGQTNQSTEDYCESCGEQRTADAAPLRPGDVFAGFEIVDETGSGEFTVRSTAGDGASLSAHLRFGPHDQLAELARVLTALHRDGPAREAEYQSVPYLLATGDDVARGTYVVLQVPDGVWTPLTEVGELGPHEARQLLQSLLLVADRAAAAGRLLVLSPANVTIDRGRIFLSAPVAPELPLAGPLLAEKEFVAPELRHGQRDLAAWQASAYAVGATIRSLTRNALGSGSEWHRLIGRLLADEPIDRPSNVQQAMAMIAASSVTAPIAVHRIAFRTDIGRHHPVNQDAGGAWTWQRSDGTPVTLAIVADGVSASERSEEASALAVEVIRAAFEAHWEEREFDSERAMDLLIEAGIDANRRISLLPAKSSDSAGATTLVAACLVSGRAAGIWCGDSRAYGVTLQGSGALTRDHSWLNMTVESGQMSLEEAKADRRSHSISRWMGYHDSLSDDPGFDRFYCDVAPGEWLLLCSDGLHMYFDRSQGGEAELAEIIYRHGEDATGAVEDLVATALDRGGYDNITAVLMGV